MSHENQKMERLFSDDASRQLYLTLKARLEGVQLHMPQIAQAIAKRKNLLLLDLYGEDENGINDEGAVAIADLLRGNPTIEEIRLGNNHIGDIGAGKLADALLTNTRLKVLSLYSNAISDSGAEALARALQVNQSLLELDVTANCIGNVGALELAKVCAVRPGLKIYGLLYSDSRPAQIKRWMEQTSENSERAAAGFSGRLAAKSNSFGRF